MKQFHAWVLFVCSSVNHAGAQTVQSFNYHWEFVKGIDTAVTARFFSRNPDIQWQAVSLPHTANIEPIQKVAQQWQGTCFYRKFFQIPASSRGKHLTLQFDAAMQVADVYLNGDHGLQHTGGYLPFSVDLTEKILFDKENCILIKLNNEDNPLVPPGKPLKDLDFNYYSGIYRNAWLITKEKLRITDPVVENRVAGGGVFVHLDRLTPDSAFLSVKTEFALDGVDTTGIQLQVNAVDPEGKQIARVVVDRRSGLANGGGTISALLAIAHPKLWTTDKPALYQLHVELLQHGKTADQQVIKTGLRTVRLANGNLYLNDNLVIIRGTNRHQDYPYLGNALSDNAQYRDAWKIKLAGFNFVRCSHYPPSPAFLDACDELGILVMDAIPGWQFVGDEAFQQHSFQDIRNMIHRDRNHPSIILWEASLNESGMPKPYMEKAHAIVHEELPFQDTYSAGWIRHAYDVFLPARQHAKPPDYWKKYPVDVPLLIAEYGDWEYYAQNAGFNQTAFADLKEEERTSRQLRGFGEKRMLQQALNYQEAHNDNLSGIILGDANWLMFDYNRGYANDIESSGIMDITRLPKFSFYFYQSQVDPVTTGATPFNKPMVFIANYWQTGSTTSVKVFSNCEEVELLLNGKSMGRKRSNKDAYSTNLKHAPFTFDILSYQPGTLTAIGYLNNLKAAEQKQATAGAPAGISLKADISGKELAAGKNDAVFVYGMIVDARGNPVPGANNQIEFKVTGDAEIIGVNPVSAEAGIATVLIRAGSKAGKIIVTATGKGLKEGKLELESK